MTWFNAFIVGVSCVVAVGCVSQQSHERALQEDKVNKEKIERLKQTIEVQDQVKEQQLTAIIQELGSLYEQVRELETTAGEISPVGPLFDVEPLDFDDLTAALEKVKSGLEKQTQEVSQLREQNRHLEKELSAKEVRLQDMDRLKKELEQVRVIRETQEAQLARVKRQVETVSEEIDRITKALEESFGTSLVVTQNQERLVLTLLGQVLFKSGEAELTPLGLKVMKQVGQVLATFPEKFIQIEGHTDNNPIGGLLQRQFPSNWELSTARATTVLRYLIEQTGMDKKQFSAAGYADIRPVHSNETEEGRAKNRRVEIVLYPERVIGDSKK